MRFVTPFLISILAAGLLGLPSSGFAQSDDADTWLPTLQTDTPEQGFALVVKLSRMGVKTTQPDVEVLKEGRKVYSKDADALIDASEVIAIHFRTIAEANDYWRDE